MVTGEGGKAIGGCEEAGGCVKVNKKKSKENKNKKKATEEGKSRNWPPRITKLEDRGGDEEEEEGEKRPIFPAEAVRS